MITKSGTVPHLTWNLTSVFFTAWCAVAGWLLAGGEESVVVRLAFALTGMLALVAGSTGGLFRQVGHLFWVRASPRIRAGVYGAFITSVISAACVFFVVQALEGERSRYRYVTAESNLTEDGVAFQEFLQAHDGLIPPKPSQVARHHRTRVTKKSERREWEGTGWPVMWCNDPSGLYVNDFPEPDKVIVAYTQQLQWHKHHLLLFLDGSDGAVSGRDGLNVLLRRQEPWIAAARRAATKPDKASRSVPQGGVR